MSTCAESIFTLLFFAQQLTFPPLFGTLACNPPMKTELQSPLTIQALCRQVTDCRLCPRLVAYRERIAREKKREFREWNYWGKPVPGYGDPKARVLVVGLAPAAHGANRTGRMFTGDSSGDFLARAMHTHGFAFSPTSRQSDDGHRLTGAYITAVVRCAPPDNKPLPSETANCLPYLKVELELLGDLCVIVALGKFAWDGVWGVLRDLGADLPTPRVPFGHGAECTLRHPFDHDRMLHLIASYHPSRQNTNTGKLTPQMLSGIFSRCREL